MQSRYYNPTWGRFLNADSFAATGQGLLGNNMFAYCGNNPVNAVDPAGMMAHCRHELATGYGGGSFSIGSLFLPIAIPIVWIGTLFNQIYTEGFIVAPQIQEKEEEKVVAEAQIQTSKQSAIYYGIDYYNGQMNYVTGPMSEEQAILWAYMTAYEGIYSKRESWGLYTAEQEDALNMALTLSPLGPIVSHAGKTKHYAHYHTVQRRIWGIDAPSFHIWYGGV